MKVIDLLNRIANEEEVPLEIKCCNKKYRYNSLSGDYEQIGGFNSLFKDLLLKYCFDLPKCLNDEVEIIKENKKIETIDPIDYCHSTDTSKDMVLVEKINEIIDYINGGTNGE